MSLNLGTGEFFAYYDNAHRNPINRGIHHAAHTCGVVGVLVLLYRPLMGVLLILVSFPMSWTGHYLFERNTPAFFEKPSRKGFGAALAKKAQVALGGVFWSCLCLWRALARQLKRCVSRATSSKA